MPDQPNEIRLNKNPGPNGDRSILQNVVSRRRARRRHGRAARWLSWFGAMISRIHLFITETIPAWSQLHKQHLITGSMSLLVHLIAAFLLMLWVLPAETSDGILMLLGAPVSKEEVAAVELTQVVQPESLDEQEFENTAKQVLNVIDDTTTDLSSIETDPELELELEPTDHDLSALVKLGDFEGRSSFGKQAALRKYGGTAESERAVNLGLRWLKTIQQSDGSWSFAAPGRGATPGRLQKTEMGSTSLALLCFLGAGHTHQSVGPYRHTVSKGLKYLMNSSRTNRTSADMRGDFQGNSGMYVQGLATLCLCEGHALHPEDTDLEQLARKAIRFIEKSQDKKGGGWRYEPGQPGDTSVLGWQVMALQSAKTGSISVSRQTGRRVKKFLNLVQTDDGAKYGYTPAGGKSSSPSMTSVGLLCRMYMGWRHDHSSLRRGIAYLSTWGPHAQNMYYNYYATQALHHWGGEEWRKWNAVMREQLVNRQITDGPAAGSWNPGDPHAHAGGQIYETALTLLTLEVYYRYLPIYRNLEN